MGSNVIYNEVVMGIFKKREQIDHKRIALEYEISLGDSQIKIFRKAVDLYRTGSKKKAEYDEKATALLNQELPEDADVDSVINDLMED